MEFTNKIILLTGASSGLGRGLALALAHYRTTLVIVARRSDRLQRLQGEIQALGSACTALQADLTDSGQAQAVIEQVITKYSRIDLAILCVGGGRPLPLEAATAEQVLNSMANNFSTMINVFLPLVRQLRIQSTPSVVAHVNSLASTIEIPRGAHYSAAKVAAQRFIETARIELRGTPVKLVSLHPGFVQTENKKEKMMLGISLQKAVSLMLVAISKEKPSYRFPWPLVLVFAIIGALPRPLRGRILASLSDRESRKYTE